MNICSQCGKKAMYSVEEGRFLCLDCFYIYTQSKQQESADYTGINNLAEHMEEVNRQRLKANLKYIGDNGNPKLADQMLIFIELLAKENMPNFIKNEVLEHIEFLSNQLAGNEAPKKGIIKSVLNSIPILISSSESLKNNWSNIAQPMAEFI